MRQVLNMNFDWQFHDGDIESPNFNSVHDVFSNPVFLKSANCGISKVGYNLHEWQTVQVPHDLRHARCDFDESVISSQGFLSTGIAWYRKEFFVDSAYENNAIIVEFDGVFRDCEVYVNGTYVGNHLSGYTSFSYDISDFVLCGESNAIAVRVDGTKFEGWWYEAAGIYRDVRLVIADTIKIKQNGVFITSDIKEKNADIQIHLELENLSYRFGQATANVDILDPNGKTVLTCKEKYDVDAFVDNNITINASITDVMLWDIDCTNQYTAVISIVYGEKTVDTYSQKFGVREIEYSPDKGVILNGRQVKIQGVCVHDDFAGVGGAMSRSVIRHKIYLLKQWGCNGYRSSHNPPSPYILEACDDFGILVMDEVRLMSSSPEYLNQMTDLIKRDRNHPSIFIWSIGNEEMAVHGTKTGVKIVNHMRRIAHDLDPTRPCTYANNCNWKEITDWHEENGLQMDVFGFNYHCKRNFQYYGYIHDKYPDRMIIGTENASTLTTRGQYLPREIELDPALYSERAMDVMIWANPDRMYNVSAYGESYPVWGATPLETMAAADYDYVAGYFIWTGFDYRGEVMPLGWPSVVSRFGVIDLCGFMKDAGHHYRVKWAQEPTVHLYPHWTFDDNVGTIQIDVVSNTEEVELFVNGVSQGRHTSPLRDVVKYYVPYEKGEIVAVAYNNGEEVTRMSHKTAGAPASVKLEVVQDREYVASGEDCIFVKVEVIDKDGTHCPNADNLIEFAVEGAGEYLGGGNGDPMSHENDMEPQRKLFNGLALAILRTGRETGKIKFTATSKGLAPATMEFDINTPATDVLVSAGDKKEVEIIGKRDAADGAF